MPVIDENWKMRPKHKWHSKLIRKYYKLRVGLTKPRNPIPDRNILEKVEKERRLVIQVPFGGLGDHLAYSSLPELLWKQKGIKTFISNMSIFRNEGIRDFVWGLNPYINFVDEKGWFINERLRDNIVIDEYLQELFHLEGNGYPKTYYKPRVIEELRGQNIVDPSCGATGKANGYFEREFYKRFIAYLKEYVGEFILITHKNIGNQNDLCELIRTEFKPGCFSAGTLEELSDVLYSANERYLLHSGGASLAAALKLKSNILNYIKPSTYEYFKYPTNKHIHLMQDGGS